MLSLPTRSSFPYLYFSHSCLITGVILGMPSEQPVTNVPLLQSPNLLWIIIACVAGVTLIAIVVFLAVLCNRRKNAAAEKSGTQANGGNRTGGGNKQENLWVDAERVSLKVRNFNSVIKLAGHVKHQLYKRKRLSQGIQFLSFLLMRLSFTGMDAFPDVSG